MKSWKSASGTARTRVGEKKNLLSSRSRDGIKEAVDASVDFWDGEDWIPYLNNEPKQCSDRAVESRLSTYTPPSLHYGRPALVRGLGVGAAPCVPPADK
ncbi:hypothetical protein EVAR_19420_1 [Eumeta japonica]|uniref:Uncharacterized protein n=1 Tax=Eumeta variegata TaxID=151549 RepID=A0A4C1TRQ8_EUMVA|nr:hypothetical protein EVAR_19420_1 [Eumeta japonica]